MADPVVVVVPTLADIETARSRIQGRVVVSPCRTNLALSAATGTDLVLKLESLQRTGSFKERGAANRVLALTDDERRRGVVTASAGNHAQAVALHAGREGVRATVVMPETTPLVKIEATRGFGAEVVLFGKTYDEAAERAAEIERERGLVYVHPFDDPWVIAGQGTLGLEILEQVPDVEAIVVPVGGGGLIAGVGCAVKERRSDVAVYGVESRAFPSMKRALEGASAPPLPGGNTIADGIAVRRVGKLATPMVRKYVDDIALVDEEEIAEAILLLLEKEKAVAEGAGAVALAALVHKRFPLAGKKVVVVVSGGNIDVNLVAKIIDRGLVKTGRLARISIVVPDIAGTLAAVADVIAETRANILEIAHDRAFSEAELGQTRMELVLETHGFEHLQRIRARLAECGWAVVG